MIRTLLKNGMSHRAISKALKISHGSVSLEKRVWKSEIEDKERIEKENAKKISAGETLVLDEATPW